MGGGWGSINKNSPKLVEPETADTDPFFPLLLFFFYIRKKKKKKKNVENEIGTRRDWNFPDSGIKAEKFFIETNTKVMQPLQIFKFLFLPFKKKKFRTNRKKKSFSRAGIPI